MCESDSRINISVTLLSGVNRTVGQEEVVMCVCGVVANSVVCGASSGSWVLCSRWSATCGVDSVVCGANSMICGTSSGNMSVWQYGAVWGRLPWTSDDATLGDDAGWMCASIILQMILFPAVAVLGGGQSQGQIIVARRGIHGCCPLAHRRV
jgi:hypothetical protein